MTDSIEKFNFLDKENNINYLTIHNLLNLSKISCFKSIDTTQLVPRTHFTNIYLNTCNENILFILVALRDKCYQLFVEARQFFAPNLEYARRMKNATPGDVHFLGQDLNVEDYFELMLKFTGIYAREVVKYAKKLPGFDRINDLDLFSIIKIRMFSFVHIITENLVIDGENYILLFEKCQTSKYMITKVFGEKVANRLFEFHVKLKKLGLSEHELAVIIPVILSSPS